MLGNEGLVSILVAREVVTRVPFLAHGFNRQPIINPQLPNKCDPLPSQPCRLIINTQSSSISSSIALKASVTN